MAYLVDGLRSAKAFPETNLYKKTNNQQHKDSSSTSLGYFSFWILAHPVHLRSTLIKVMECTKACITSADTGQEGANDPLHLEVWIEVSHRGAGKQIWVRCKSKKCF